MEFPKFTKKSWYCIAACFIAISAFGLYQASHSLEDITISQSAIQERVDASMPITHEVRGIKAAIDQARVELKGKESTINFTGHAKGFGQKAELEAEINGELIYERGVFYIDVKDLQIKKLELTSILISDSWREPVNKGVAFALANRLNHLPVYKLEGLKGTIIKSAIESVEVGEKAVHIRLSLWQLTYSVMIFLLSLVAGLALAVALIINPEYLGPFILLSAITPIDS